MNQRKRFFTIITILLLATFLGALDYPIVDTGQTDCFNNTTTIESPSAGEAFFGQDAQYDGNQPQYTDNGDGTVTDNITGLMWQKGYSEVKRTFSQAVEEANDFELAGYTDWRLPTIKELYSLILFSGIDPSGYEGTDVTWMVPFIDTDYFDFRYGLSDEGERVIDAQYVSSTEYVGTVFNGVSAVFGVNFADGRIKGYPSGVTEMGEKLFEVKYVRGATSYGTNDFVNFQDGIVVDHATGLMWTLNDSGEAMNWQEALAWVQQCNAEEYLGYSDWRLPNVKELESLVDYTRAPDVTDSPAIDPIFNVTAITNEGGVTDYPYFWSSTTHENFRDTNGEAGCYVSFGRALGWMTVPRYARDYVLMDVHGAGAQRSDYKAGDPGDYPYGHGPQGDVVRMYNFVRLVRDSELEVDQDTEDTPETGMLEMDIFPNPFNPDTTIKFDLDEPGNVTLDIFNVRGQKVQKLVNGILETGSHYIAWNGKDLAGKSVSSGIYLARLQTEGSAVSSRMTLLK